MLSSSVAQLNKGRPCGSVAAKAGQLQTCWYQLHHPGCNHPSLCTHHLLTRQAFAKENARMEMASEMMGDAVDSALAGEDEEEETDEMVRPCAAPQQP